MDGRQFIAHFRKRPFREGVEVVVEVDGTTVRIAELGLGDGALMERIKSEIRRITTTQKS